MGFGDFFTVEDEFEAAEPESPVVFPEDEVAAPVRSGVGHVGEDAALAGLAEGEKRIAGFGEAEQDFRFGNRAGLVVAENGRTGGKIDFGETRFS